MRINLFSLPQNYHKQLILARPRHHLPCLPTYLSQVVPNKRTGCFNRKDNQQSPLATWHVKCIMNLLPWDQGAEPVWGSLWGSNLNTANVLTFSYLPWLQGGIQTDLELSTANLLTFDYLLCSTNLQGSLSKSIASN